MIKLMCVPLLLLAGCPRTSSPLTLPPEPCATLGKYLHAVLERDVRAAYGLLAAGTHPTTSFARFELFFRKNYKEILDEAQHLQRQASRKGCRVVAELRLGDRSLIMERDVDGWRLSEEPLGFVGFRTPQALLAWVSSTAYGTTWYGFYHSLSPNTRMQVDRGLALLRRKASELSDRQFQKTDRINIDFGVGGLLVVGRHGKLWKIDLLTLPQPE